MERNQNRTRLHSRYLRKVQNVRATPRRVRSYRIPSRVRKNVRVTSEIRPLSYKLFNLISREKQKHFPSHFSGRLRTFLACLKIFFSQAETLKKLKKKIFSRCENVFTIFNN